jgi:hypothetical protein
MPVRSSRRIAQLLRAPPAIPQSQVRQSGRSRPNTSAERQRKLRTHRDANLRAGELTAMMKSSRIRGQNNGESARARDGEPYKVDGNSLHRSSS